MIITLLEFSLVIHMRWSETSQIVRMHRQDWSVVAFIQDGAIYIGVLNTPHQPSGLNAVDINKVYAISPSTSYSDIQQNVERQQKLEVNRNTTAGGFSDNCNIHIRLINRINWSWVTTEASECQRTQMTDVQLFHDDITPPPSEFWPYHRRYWSADSARSNWYRHMEKDDIPARTTTRSYAWRCHRK